MNAQILKQKSFVFILATVLIVSFGIQGIGYAQAANPTMTASVQQPLTEATLHESVVTLTLSGRSFVNSTYSVSRALTLSGVEDVTFKSWDVNRVSDTEVTVELTFSGNIDVDTPLVFTMGPGGITDYDGETLTAQLPVTAVEESLTTTTAVQLIEANLHGSIITLKLSGRQFAESWDIKGALTLSGIEGATVSSRYLGVERVSNTEVNVKLAFAGNIDTDTTLTLTVGADAIVGYNIDFTFNFPVTAVEESLTATTEVPLTETNLHGSILTLTLNGRQFADSNWDIERRLTISGIEGVAVNDSFQSVYRVSDTEVTVVLAFAGNIDTDTTLTLTVGADAIVGYNIDFTVTISITAIEESLTATTVVPLTESTLDGSIVTLTLSGRRFDRRSDIRGALTFSGIEGVTVATGVWGDAGVVYVSDTEAKVTLAFFGNIDTDATLTLTVGADAINYNKDFTFNFPVTAIEESLTATTEAPLTEADLQGGVITLTLSGRRFVERAIKDALTVSGIDGVAVSEYGVVRVSDTKATFELAFFGNIDTDATLTLTVGADAINYNKDFTFNFPVTAVEESLTATTETPLTEADLQGGIITLTLDGRRFANRDTITDALTLSGIEGVTVGSIYTSGVDRVRDIKAIVVLAFSGNFDTDAMLTLTVGAAAISYTKDFIFNFPVTAVEESLTVTTEAPLIEANLDVNVITLSVSGRRFANRWDIEGALTLSGIEGVTVSYVDRISDTEAKVNLGFAGDFDTDATLTLTVGADAIGYTKDFTFKFPVIAVEKSNATVSVSPSPIALPAIGEKLTLNLDIANGKNVAGYQATVLFDPSVLNYVESANGNYLPADTFFLDPIDRYRQLVIAGNTLAGARNGDGTLATLTFEVVDYKPSMVTLSDVYLVDADGKRWEVTIKNGEILEPPQKIFGDINLDGVVNIQDLVIVTARFGLRGRSGADVNGDGLVDIVDLVLVANAFGANAAAPSVNPQVLELLTAADVKGWLTQAQQLSFIDPAYLRGITVLEQLHKALTPKATALLANYPNPFNPETWIPYHLAKDAEVTMHIYAMNGTLVRTLALGHQAAGMYQNRSRAAYWDGKNEFGEKVASALYFYTLTAGDFTATRKMYIRK